MPSDDVMAPVMTMVPPRARKDAVARAIGRSDFESTIFPRISPFAAACGPPGGPELAGVCADTNGTAQTMSSAIAMMKRRTGVFSEEDATTREVSSLARFIRACERRVSIVETTHAVVTKRLRASSAEQCRVVVHHRVA